MQNLVHLRATALVGSLNENEKFQVMQLEFANGTASFFFSFLIFILFFPPKIHANFFFICQTVHIRVIFRENAISSLRFLNICVNLSAKSHFAELM